MSVRQFSRWRTPWNDFKRQGDTHKACSLAHSSSFHIFEPKSGSFIVSSPARSGWMLEDSTLAFMGMDILHSMLHCPRLCFFGSKKRCQTSIRSQNMPWNYRHISAEELSVRLWSQWQLKESGPKRRNDGGGGRFGSCHALGTSLFMGLFSTRNFPPRGYK